MSLKLRFLKKNDINELLLIENDRRYWHLSGTTKPFTQRELLNYIENQSDDIKKHHQLRFVIEVNKQFTGLIDLYDYDEQSQSAGIGIFILEPFRNMGIASKALLKLLDFIKIKINLKSVFARIENTNSASIHVFEKTGFKAQKELKNYIQKGDEKLDCKEYWLNI